MGVIVSATLFALVVVSFVSNYQSNVDEAEEWKTYRNTEYGLELQYPGNLDFSEIHDTENTLRVNFFYNGNNLVGPIEINIVKDGSFLLDDNNIVGEKKIGGISGKTYAMFTGDAYSHCEQTSVYNDNLIYVFSDNCGENMNVFNQILSTVRLTKKGTAADWKMYINTNCGGYTLQYPSDWFVDASNTANVYVTPNLGHAKSGESIQILADTVTSNTPLEYIAQSKYGTLGTDFTQKHVIIGGKDALKIKTICESVGCGAPEWMVRNNGCLFTFTSGLDSDKLESAFEKIISTFKFTK